MIVDATRKEYFILSVLAAKQQTLSINKLAEILNSDVANVNTFVHELQEMKLVEICKISDTNSDLCITKRGLKTIRRGVHNKRMYFHIPNINIENISKDDKTVTLTFTDKLTTNMVYDLFRKK